MLENFELLTSVIGKKYEGQFIRVYSDGSGIVDQGYVIKVQLYYISYDTTCLCFTLKKSLKHRAHQILLFLTSRIELVSDPDKIDWYIKEHNFLENIVKSKTKHRIQHCRLDTDDYVIDAFLFDKKNNYFLWEKIQLDKAQIKAYNKLVG